MRIPCSPSRLALGAALFPALVAAALIFPGLGGGSLSNYDEACYAEVSREASRGHVWRLHYNGRLWLDKPPLYFWLSGALMKIQGPSEWTARAPSACFGVLTVLLVFLIGREIRGGLTGFLAALLLATSPSFLFTARQGMIDTTVLALTALALYAGLRGRRGDPVWYGLIGPAVALALLAKYLVAILPLLILFPVLAPALRGDPRGRRALVTGAAVGALLALPWFAVQAAADWKGFVHNFWFFNVQTRVFEGMTLTDAGYYARTLRDYNQGHFFAAGGILAIVYFGARLLRERDAGDGLYAAWLGVVVFALAMTRTQLAWYVVLLYPILALLLADVLTAFLKGAKDGLSAVIVLWGVAALLHHRAPDFLHGLPILTGPVWAGVFALGLTLPGALTRTGAESPVPRRRWIPAAALLLLGFHAPASLDFSPEEKAIARAANELEGAALLGYRLNRQHPVAFYTDAAVEWIPSRAEFEQRYRPSERRQAAVLTTRAGALDLGAGTIRAREGSMVLLTDLEPGRTQVVDLEISAAPEVVCVLYSNGTIERRSSGYSEILYEADCDAVDMEMVFGETGFLVLDRHGVVHPLGAARSFGDFTAGGTVRDLAITGDGSGYLILAENGVVQGFGSAPRFDNDLQGSPYRALALVLTDDENGLFVFYENGLIYPLGAATEPEGVTGAVWNWEVGLDMERDPAGTGYYLCDQYGVVHYAGNKPNPPTPYYNPEKGHAVDFEVAPDGRLYILDDQGAIYR